MKDFLVSFRMDGARYSAIIQAENWADADKRLMAMGRGSVIGSDVYRVRTCGLTFPIDSLLVRLRAGHHKRPDPRPLRDA